MTSVGPRVPKPVFTLPVEDDPLSWLTDQFRQAGVFATSEESTKYLPTPKAMSAALGITSSIVTALSDHEKVFNVRFSPSAQTASTYLKSREVIIGIKPMLDPRLTEGQRAALMVALAYHEVGHVIWTADMEARFTKRYPENKPAQKVFNVVHDLLLEARQQVDYPGYAPTLRVKQAYWGKQWVVRLNSRRNRLGALIQATLYPQGSDWTTSTEVVDWFIWATDWAERCRDVRAGKSPNYLFGLINEGLAALRLDEPDVVDPTEQPEEERPDTGEDSEDGEGEDGEDDDPYDFDDYDDEGDMQEDPFEEDEPKGTPPPTSHPDEGEEPEPDESDTDDEGDPEPPQEQSDKDADEDAEEDDEEGKDTPVGGGHEDESDEQDAPADDESDKDVPDEDTDEGGKPEGGITDPDDDSIFKEDEPRDEWDDPSIPQAHPESDEGAAEWQEAIDDYERVQVKGRDKVVVGGGNWKKREVRILRLA